MRGSACSINFALIPQKPMDSAPFVVQPHSVVPMYQDGASRYFADTCAPLVAAAQSRLLKFAALARGHYPGYRLDAEVLPGILSLGHWDARRQQSWGLPWHRNEGMEFCYLESGSLDFSVGAAEFTLQPGDVAITRPWQPHRVGNPNIGPSRLHWIILDVGVRHPEDSWVWPDWLLLSRQELEELRCALLIHDRPVLRVSSDVRHCFLQIAHAAERHATAADSSRLAIRINDLILCLLELFRAQPAPSGEVSTDPRQHVHLFLRRLARNGSSLAQPWTVESMAATCGLKVTQFASYVKELTNLPPLHYLNQCRLEYASRLLLSRKEVRITDVALACGFSSSQYFATLFRQRFGATPTNFCSSRASASILPDSAANTTGRAQAAPTTAAAAPAPGPSR